MAEYIDRDILMDDLKPIVYGKDGFIVNNMASSIVYRIQGRETADVIEREKIAKAIEEIENKSYYINEITEEMGIDIITVKDILKKHIEEADE